MKKHLLIIFLLIGTGLQAQHSVARKWNEVVLEGIRNDFARPTVHARNLYHTSIAMYDAWAAFDERARPYFLGYSIDGFPCPFEGIPAPANVREAREQAISFAVYRIIRHRFTGSPDEDDTFRQMDDLMDELGYDAAFTSTDYSGGDARALGNYIAQCIINFGFQDGSNEDLGYENQFYQPVNDPLVPEEPGNPNITDGNRWQPLSFDSFIDQSGNVVGGATPDFLSPEWGQVVPFAMQEEDLTIYNVNGFDFYVYHDPGTPPMLGGDLDEEYKWGFALVSTWSAHLDPGDSVKWDISPGSIGNNPPLPTDFTEYPNFYDFIEGGDLPGDGSSTRIPVSPILKILFPGLIMPGCLRSSGLMVLTLKRPPAIGLPF